MWRSLGCFLAALLSLSLLPNLCAAADAAKPNILVIWGDDIGWFNTSAYNRGMMGYTTPNIDSIANQGILFQDAYGQQSCTAGRAAFITGQTPFRTAYRQRREDEILNRSGKSDTTTPGVILEDENQ